VRENPKRRAQHTKTGNKCKQAQAAPKESINSTIRLFFDEQTLCDEFLEDLRGVNGAENVQVMEALDK
jgi:hypothetical protein